MSTKEHPKKSRKLSDYNVTLRVSPLVSYSVNGMDRLVLKRKGGVGRGHSYRLLRAKPFDRISLKYGRARRPLEKEKSK